jgi:hypothetical protein
MILVGAFGRIGVADRNGVTLAADHHYAIRVDQSVIHCIHRFGRVPRKPLLTADADRAIVPAAGPGATSVQRVNQEPPAASGTPLPISPSRGRVKGSRPFEHRTPPQLRAPQR